MLCLTGEAGWARLSTGPTQIVGATPIAIFLREHADARFALRQASAEAQARADGTGDRDSGDRDARSEAAEAILSLPVASWLAR
jgi:hypothetical protein